MGFAELGRRALERAGFVSVQWINRESGSALEELLPRALVRPGRTRIDDVIEARQQHTARLGAQPLWDGYGEASATRTSNQVRTAWTMGRLYTDLARKHRPGVLVEFGSAFGVSGMFWLAGLEAVQHGWLYTFEPNEVWASIARGNLSAIGHRFTLTVGTFEKEMESVLPTEPIDLAFIDAIHTSEFVGPQFELIAARSRPGSLVILDDINFSQDMHDFWLNLVKQPRTRASATLGERVGIVELS
jgi:predicted O-methyltransferase YrrM